MVALLACGGSNATLVYIAPSTATVNAGATLQFTSNVPVTWSVSGNGVIDNSGYFKAGNTSGTVTITAIARDGSGSSGTATVTISTTTTTTTTTTTSSPSGIAHRVFVSNKYSGVLNIVDADTDQLSTHTVVVGGTPTFMVQTTDQTAEVVYDSTNNLLSLVDNTTETVETTTSAGGTTVGAKAALAGTIESAVIIPGGTAAYAAVPTASVASGITGAVYEASFATGGFLSVGIQGARYLSMDHNAVNMLVFSQNSDTVNLVTSSTSTLTSSTGTLTPQPLLSSSSAPNCSTTFSRPVAAVFSSDDTTAYVLSSGPANGGTQAGGTQPATAMVTVLDMTQTLLTAAQALPTLPNIVQCINVSGANVGLLQGTQLYVAGAAIQSCSSGQCQQGILTVIDTSALTASSPVTFGPSAPNLLPGVLTFDGTNLWIGSTGCQVSSGAAGCLSLYSPANSQILATNFLPGGLTDQTDDITGMVWLQPFNGRNIMYVIEGGALQVYDNSFNNLTTTVINQTGLFITGQAVGAEAVKN